MDGREMFGKWVYREIVALQHLGEFLAAFGDQKPNP
jgi:hypothetical protein